MSAYGFDEQKNKVPVYSTSEVYSKIEATPKTETGNLSNLRTSAKSSIVDALNEVFQNANDGKAKLAAAIGSSITNSGVTPPRPSLNSTWDQMVNGLIKVKIATSGANDFSVSVKSERVQGSNGSGTLQFKWDYTRYTHTTSKFYIPFSNIIFVIGSGEGEDYTAPIGPNNGNIRSGFGDWGAALLTYSKTTEDGNNYLQMNVRTIKGTVAIGAPEYAAAQCGRLQTMSYVIVGY